MRRSQQFCGASSGNKALRFTKSWLTLVFQQVNACKTIQEPGSDTQPLGAHNESSSLTFCSVGWKCLNRSTWPDCRNPLNHLRAGLCSNVTLQVLAIHTRSSKHQTASRE